MKIVHISITAAYHEGFGFQENLLTKYQVKLGHDVTLITSCKENRPEGGGYNTVAPCDYISPDGFRLIRLEHKKFRPRKLCEAYKIFDIYSVLKEIKPDFIMVHGLSNFSVLQAAKYIKKINPNCIMIADNHLDYNIGSMLLGKKLSTRFFRATLRLLNKKMQKYYAKVYGVTPWRCEFCNDIFGISEDKLDVLPAGADDQVINYENRDAIRAEIRKKHNISDDDFLIVTGGKIDKRKNIHTLMQAITEIENKKIKLLVFGQASNDIADLVNELAKHEQIIYIGWLDSSKTYDYFMAADLAFFPGQHSVMWEQTVACGTPLVMKHFHAMHHCDIGGNCKFLYDDTKDGILKLINEITQGDTYKEMLNVARSEKRKQFYYSGLAEKSLEVTRR